MYRWLWLGAYAFLMLILAAVWIGRIGFWPLLAIVAGMALAVYRWR